jgi:hypothetical protein
MGDSIALMDAYRDRKQKQASPPQSKKPSQSPPQAEAGEGITQAEALMAEGVSESRARKHPSRVKPSPRDFLMERGWVPVEGGQFTRWRHPEKA